MKKIIIEKKEKPFFWMIVIGMIMTIIGHIITTFQAMPVPIFLGYLITIVIIIGIGVIGTIYIRRKNPGVLV